MLEFALPKCTNNRSLSVVLFGRLIRCEWTLQISKNFSICIEAFNYSLNFHSCRQTGQCCWACCDWTHLRIQCIWKWWVHWPTKSNNTGEPVTYTNPDDVMQTSVMMGIKRKWYPSRRQRLCLPHISGQSSPGTLQSGHGAVIAQWLDVTIEANIQLNRCATEFPYRQTSFCRCHMCHLWNPSAILPLRSTLKIVHSNSQQ